VKNQLAITFNEMGIVLYSREQYAEAITLFNESLSYNTADWGVYANRGDCYRLLGKIEDAQKDYIKAKKICGEKEELNFRLSIINNSKGIILFNERKYL